MATGKAGSFAKGNSQIGQSLAWNTKMEIPAVLLK
jgi:hypothetical protein